MSSSCCRRCFLSSLGIELVTSCSLWSAATCPCDGVGQWKSRSFCLWLLYDLENLLDLKFSRSWSTSAFVHGAVVLSAPDSHTVLRGAPGAEQVLIGRPRARLWPWSEFAFVFALPCTWIVCWLAPVRRSWESWTWGRNLLRDYLSPTWPGAEAGHQTRLFTGPQPQFIVSCTHRGHLLLQIVEPKGPSPFPFPFSSHVWNHLLAPAVSSCLPTHYLRAKNLGYFVFINVSTGRPILLVY